ncbi:unnamed protein product [Darwinula stevensoni]|uniref:Uncharacterized protein n=1 Tax=Darwinula stevensoni TaxID=69355 RepID=A0A7R8X3Y9_9CRUS|nr:unnamed protein product [Darwinula stevensoni]CAG0885492.1 unnamed protein product [Darwinula stevensoni]
MISYVRPIWSLYSRWKEYMNYRNDLERETLDDLASAVVSHHPHSTLSLLWSIHDLVVPHKASIRAGIFQHLKDLIDHDAATCDLGQSPQQLAYGLYKLIAATETKAFAMMTFSWMLLRESGKGNFSRETKLAQLGHVKREEEALMNAREVMENLSRVFWRCDPEVHLEGVTYLQVTDLLQGYIENEVDMNSEGTCTQTCSAYGNGFPDVRTGCTDNRKQKFCSMQRPCNGNIFNCKFIDADAWVCLSDKPERRYGYIEYENADPGKVVTGIKFEKVDNIFYLKIQQGYPMAGGEVKPSSVEWKPVDPYETLSAAPKDGYMTLTYEDRAVDLDDLFAPAGHVITGVGFRRLGAHLGLTIQVTPINFTTGELKPDLSYWKSNMNTDASDKNPRKQLPLVDVAVPIYTVFDSVVDSHHDMWLQFGPTSEVKDAAQTTVPFLDAQEVFSRDKEQAPGGMREDLQGSMRENSYESHEGGSVHVSGGE